jgi:hypothetical protein
MVVEKHGDVGRVRVVDAPEPREQEVRCPRRFVAELSVRPAALVLFEENTLTRDRVLGAGANLVSQRQIGFELQWLVRHAGTPLASGARCSQERLANYQIAAAV